MESRIWIFLLIISLLPNQQASAAEKAAENSDATAEQILQQEPIIQPEVQRRVIKEADIDKSDFELGPYLGLLSIEDFGTNPVYGIRLSYFVTEDLFIEGVIGQSKAGKTSFENFSGGINLLTDEQRKYTYYNVGIGYNILPGEAYLTEKTTFNTAFYVLIAGGSTKFAGDDRFTLTFGGGYRITAKDWMTVRFDFRDHIFAIDVTGEDKEAHNFETTMSINFIF